MTDPDTNAKSLAEVHAEILRLADAINARLSRVEKLVEEICETIARAVKAGGEGDNVKPD